MSELSLRRVEEIGQSAARAVAGETVRGVKVRRALDSTDQLADYLYFLSERVLPEAAFTSLSIAQKVRDTLVQDGDDAYPHVRPRPRDEWERRRVLDPNELLVVAQDLARPASGDPPLRLHGV